MKLYLDNPISIEEARKEYSDAVKFVTSISSYPQIEAIEFDESVAKRIYKKKLVAPRVHRLSNKIVANYAKSLDRAWKSGFGKIKNVLSGPRKQTSVAVNKNQKEEVRSIIDTIVDRMSESARTEFRNAFKLGKLRGQVLADVELDDDITNEEEAIIEDRFNEHEEYMFAFAKDIDKALEKLYTEDFATYDELRDAITEKVEETQKSRANLYPLAILGLVAAGTVYALKKAKEEFPEFVPDGGYWVSHPDEGKGGEICEGCEDNIGKFFTWDEFDKEYQSNNCLTRCRCTLDPERS